MEDHHKSKTDSADQGDEKTIELTQEMELSDQNDGNIIDLTNSVDGPEGPEGPSVEPMQAPPEIKAETPAEMKESQPAPVSTDRPDIIEEEVDAAFEAVQTAPSQDMKEDVPDAQLFDKLSDIAEMVDNTVREHESSQDSESEETELSPTGLDIADEAEIAADAALFEAAMGTELKEEEILDLNDIVDPSEAELIADPLEEDEIIELTEIVDPAVLAQTPATESETEEILELTDIVDPAQVAVQTDYNEEVVELTDIITPEEIETAEGETMTGVADESHIPEPSIDALDISESEGGEAIEEPEFQDAPDISESEEAEEIEEPESVDDTSAASEEIADLFVEEMTPDDPMIEENDFPALENVGTPLSELDELADEQEQVIQLSDVLGHSTRDDRPPIEEIKMGAEEELAANPISLEREDTANALGLNLEKPATEEEKPIQDQKIEAAVEHILQTKYAETIDRLIADAVEKAVKQEMEAIKRSLGDDDAEA